ARFAAAGPQAISPRRRPTAASRRYADDPGRRGRLRRRDRPEARGPESRNRTARRRSQRVADGLAKSRSGRAARIERDAAAAAGRARPDDPGRESTAANREPPAGRPGKAGAGGTVAAATSRPAGQRAGRSAVGGG